MKNRLNIFIFVLILCIISSIIIIFKINDLVMPIISDYAVTKMKNYTTNIINNSIINTFGDYDNVIKIEKDESGSIKLIDYDYANLNKKLSILTANIIDELDKDNINMYKLSMGNITNNIFLSNIGPNIPIKLNIIGTVLSNIDTEVIEYGINNAMIKVYVKVEVTEEVIMPFLNKKTTVITKIPISIKTIEGSIPKYYGTSIEKESNILSIPIDDDL